jgi:hypothetical protein
MTDNGFWNIVVASGTYQVSLDARNEAIKGRLDRLDAESRVKFGFIYDKLDRAAYRWDLWGRPTRSMAAARMMVSTISEPG